MWFNRNWKRHYILPQLQKHLKFPKNSFEQLCLTLVNSSIPLFPWKQQLKLTRSRKVLIYISAFEQTQLPGIFKIKFTEIITRKPETGSEKTGIYLPDTGEGTTRTRMDRSVSHWISNCLWKMPPQKG